MSEQDYPILDRNDCPNKLYSLLRTEIKESEGRQSSQIHDYHLELLSVKQSVINVQMVGRLLALGLIILLAVVLIR